MGACLAREREETDAILPDRNVQRHSVPSLSRLRAHWLMAIVRGGGWGRNMYSGIAASPISLLSMGGVFVRSLTAGWFSLLEGNMLHLFSIMTLWFYMMLFKFTQQYYVISSAIDAMSYHQLSMLCHMISYRCYVISSFTDAMVYNQLPMLYHIIIHYSI